MTLNPQFYSACCEHAMSQNAMRCPVCRTNLPYRAKLESLRMGDDVRLFDGGAYNVGTVNRIDERGVRVLRPYIQPADFLYTGGVITTIGFEEFILAAGTEVIVLQESRVREVVATETDEGRKRRAS